MYVLTFGTAQWIQFSTTALFSSLSSFFWAAGKHGHPKPRAKSLWFVAQLMLVITDDVEKMVDKKSERHDWCQQWMQWWQSPIQAVGKWTLAIDQQWHNHWIGPWTKNRFLTTMMTVVAPLHLDMMMLMLLGLISHQWIGLAIIGLYWFWFFGKDQ